MNINRNKYQIRFFKVGEGAKGGDAILITLYDEKDNEHLILIDGGYQKTGIAIIKYIKEHYRNHVIDYVFNTHPDRDHISGLIEVINSDEIKVKHLVYNRPWVDASLKKGYFADKRITSNSLLERIKQEFDLAVQLEDIAVKKNIPIYPAMAGKNYYGVLYVLSPTSSHYQQHLLLSDKTPQSTLEQYNKPYVRKEYSEEEYDGTSFIEWYDEEVTSEINETSVVLYLNLDNTKFLFTGDAGKQSLEAALDITDNQLDVTHLQLPHHGSRKNIDPDLICRINASYYIISCPPDGEKEGHPSRRLMNKILELNPDAEIYKTKDANFIFHEGVEVKATAQSPQGISQYMDGKIV